LSLAASGRKALPDQERHPTARRLVEIELKAKKA
jgi:hypothetical protein